MSTDRDAGLDIDGPAAPPRLNGELVFTAPWQSRLFGTTMRLWEQERFDWETFRQGLIAQIAAHEADLATDGRPVEDWAFDYWGCWQRALEVVLTGAGLVTTAELDSRGEVLAARPPDH